MKRKRNKRLPLSSDILATMEKLGRFAREELARQRKLRGRRAGG